MPRTKSNTSPRKNQTRKRKSTRTSPAITRRRQGEETQNGRTRKRKTTRTRPSTARRRPAEETPNHNYNLRSTGPIAEIIPTEHSNERPRRFLPTITVTGPSRIIPNDFIHSSSEDDGNGIPRPNDILAAGDGPFNNSYIIEIHPENLYQDLHNELDIFVD